MAKKKPSKRTSKHQAKQPATPPPPEIRRTCLKCLSPRPDDDCKCPNCSLTPNEAFDSLSPEAQLEAAFARMFRLGQEQGWSSFQRVDGKLVPDRDASKKVKKVLPTKSATTIVKR